MSVLVIMIGGLYLTIPETANANAVTQEKVSKCKAGNGAECTCSGRCKADGDSCECL